MEAIHDHAIIGNCRAAALVSKRGTIDWLCWPRFDSPSVFGALLDDRAGHWSLHPTAPFVSHQRYLPGTNVLETRFEVEGGEVVVCDLMPVASEEEKHLVPLAEHEILRVVRCTRGEVGIETHLRARPDYGRKAPRIRDAGRLGIRLSLHAEGHLRKIPVEIFEKNRALIRNEVQTRAWNPRLRSYTARLDGEEVDASTLLLSWYGFEPADSPRMRLTYAHIRATLGAGNGLLHRYRRPGPLEEGAFGIASFWAVEYLALGGGSAQEAEALFLSLPRMASEDHGPTVVRQLEPPGFLALNYGVRTPVSVVIAHLAFGAILGAFYAT